MKRCRLLWRNRDHLLHHAISCSRREPLRLPPADTSEIDSIQVAEVDISPGDIIQDYLAVSTACLEVIETNLEKQDYTIVRHITFRDIDTEAQVYWTWHFAISNQTVVGGPKLEDVRRNPTAYSQHLGRHIGKPTAKNVA